ncbi:hypothetical protein Syun_027972 [Stephania yunnanensis]|uniref:Uncharacterized protein n=1 Tax=Stephania yunnanensis TaxID=152371 RepID=A0AAP0HQP8_9MAGN
MLTTPLTALCSSRTFSPSLTAIGLTFSSSLSLTEISLPNHKSLPSLRLRQRRGRRLCGRRLPEIGAFEALSSRRPTPHPKTERQASRLRLAFFRAVLSQDIGAFDTDLLARSCWQAALCTLVVVPLISAIGIVYTKMMNEISTVKVMHLSEATSIVKQHPQGVVGGGAGDGVGPMVIFSGFEVMENQ